MLTHARRCLPEHSADRQRTAIPTEDSTPLPRARRVGGGDLGGWARAGAALARRPGALSGGGALRPAALSRVRPERTRAAARSGQSVVSKRGRVAASRSTPQPAVRSTTARAGPGGVARGAARGPLRSAADWIWSSKQSGKSRTRFNREGERSDAVERLREANRRQTPVTLSTDVYGRSATRSEQAPGACPQYAR